MRRNIRLSLRTKMTLGFLAVNLLSLALVLGAANSFFGSVIRSDFNRMSGDAASRFNFHMNAYIEQMIASTASIAANTEVQRYLRSDRVTSDVTEAIEKEMRKFSSTNHPEITAMFLMSRQRSMVSSFSYYYSQPELYSDELWFSLPFESEPQVIPTHFTKYPGQPPYAVMSLVIPIFDIDSIQVVGRLIVDIMPKSIPSMFGEERIGKSGFFFVVSPDDILVYHPRSDWAGFSRSKTPLASLDLPNGAETVQRKWNGEQWLVSINKSNKMNWNIVSMVPVEETDEGLKAVQKAILIAFAVVTVVILMLVPFMTHQFVKRVVALKNVMGKAATGNLDVRAPVEKRGDEFGQLNASFNHMVSQLQQLMGTVYDLRMNEMKLEIREKEALIRALQNQINPHLLYNTLGIIKSMAYLDNRPKIETMAGNLADVYRYTARFNHEEVTLRDELDILSKYLEIVRLRFPMTFIRTISVPESFYSCLTMKLTLQPIVENAVKYAIEPNAGEGAIIVGAYRDVDDLVVEIADNGKGIPEPQLADIRDMLRKAADDPGTGSAPQGSLGLSNVHARLLLRYGPGYGIRIDSFAGRGTVVSIRLPYRTESPGKVREIR
ncbi:cache domain-containing sensor histidine kinase [Paenibacillus ginsengarvi]|nr:sensor histidine kinase [Paenibacillus ginsengarvi]